MGNIVESIEITQERLLIERGFVRYEYAAVLPYPFYTHPLMPGTLFRLHDAALCVIDKRGDSASISLLLPDSLDYWVKAMETARAA